MYLYSEEQILLRESVTQYGARNWSTEDRLRKMPDLQEHVRDTWREMGELGWLMLSVSEEDGGLGGTPADVVALMEGIGRYLIPVPYIASCVMAPALLRNSGEKASEVLQGIASGEFLVASAIFETPDHPDAMNVRTTAQLFEGSWRLSGLKPHVEDGGEADWYIISAKVVDSDVVSGEIGLFLVPASAKGLSRTRFLAVDGHTHAQIELDDVRDAQLLVGDDTYSDRVAYALDIALLAYIAEAVGSIEATNEATLEYIKTRKQFGVPIGSFQVLQHRAVDMHIAAEEARAMMYRATEAMASGITERRKCVSAAKALVGQNGLYIARDAIQMHGGIGVCDEMSTSHHLKRQMMIEIALGGSAYHQELLCGQSR